MNILLISGFDSQVLYHKLKNDGVDFTPVYFKFGLPNEKAEVDSLPKETIIFDVGEDFKYSDGDVEYINGMPKDLHGRDSLMYVLTAHKFRPERIYSGVLFSDSFRECSTSSRMAFTTVATAICGHECEVIYPWVSLKYTKFEVNRYAEQNNINTESFITCFNESPCDYCIKCVERNIYDVKNERLLADYLSLGTLTDKQRETIHYHFGTDSDVEIYRKFGL